MAAPAISRRSSLSSSCVALTRLLVPLPLLNLLKQYKKTTSSRTLGRVTPSLHPEQSWSDRGENVAPLQLLDNLKLDPRCNGWHDPKPQPHTFTQPARKLLNTTTRAARLSCSNLGGYTLTRLNSAVCSYFLRFHSPR